MEAGFDKKTRQKMRGGRPAVDGGDEYAAVTVEAHLLLAAGAEKMREARCGLRALRLFIGKKDEQVGIALATPEDQMAVAQLRRWPSG